MRAQAKASDHGTALAPRAADSAVRPTPSRIGCREAGSRPDGAPASPSRPPECSPAGQAANLIPPASIDTASTLSPG